MAIIDITPVMTSDTTPSPCVVSASSVNGVSYAWKAFNGSTVNPDDMWLSASIVATVESPHWIKIDFGEKKVANVVKITQRNASPPSSLPYPPEEFKIEGSTDDISWDVLNALTITSWENREEKIFTLENQKGYRYYRISVTKCLNKSYNFVSFGEVRFCYDDSVLMKKEMKNKLKNSISVDGFVEINNTGIIPETPITGNVKIFIKDGKLYQIDGSGTQSEVGSGSSISGKVVTGIISGQNKIVISFNDETSQEIPVITDLNTIEHDVLSVKNSVNSLKVRTHAGDELDYLYAKNFGINGNSGEFLPLIKDNGNMEITTSGSFLLNEGKKYLISFQYFSTSTSGDYANIYLYDKVNSKNLSNMQSVVQNHAGAYSSPSGTGIIVDAVEDMEIGLVVGENTNLTNVKVDVIVQEIGRTYFHNPVREVDALTGIQDTPVGHVISHIGLTAPTHYLVCDGKEYNVIDYPKLAEHFLTHFGSYNYFGGDGINTFAVPDMRGEFVRGYDNEAIRDPEGTIRGVGKHQEATKSPMIFRGANANFNTYDSTKDIMEENFDARVGTNNSGNGMKVSTTPYTTSVATTHYISRPTNVNVLFCIKYEPTYYMEYHPKYATFKKDIIFDGILNSGEITTLSKNILEYDFLLINRIKKDSSKIVPILTSNNQDGYIVSCSNPVNSTYGGYKAFNGTAVDAYDCWLSTGTGENWLKIELPNPRKIGTYIIKTRKGDTGNSTPRVFSIQGSNDGLIWDTLDERDITDSVINISTSVSFEFSVQDSAYYKYYRLLSKKSLSGFTGLGEIELYEPNEDRDSILFCNVNKDTIVTEDGVSKVKVSGNSMQIFSIESGWVVDKVIGVKGTDLTIGVV